MAFYKGTVQIAGGGSASAAAWGMITGDIGSQADLAAALRGKSDVNHNHDERYALKGEGGGGAIDGEWYFRLSLNCSNKSEWEKLPYVELVPNTTTSTTPIEALRYTVQNDCVIGILLSDISHVAGGGEGDYPCAVIADVINPITGELANVNEFFELFSGRDPKTNICLPVKKGTQFLFTMAKIKYSDPSSTSTKVIGKAELEYIDYTEVLGGNAPVVTEFKLHSLSTVIGNGTCVPKYDAYDSTKHDVLVDDVTTYGNNSPATEGYGYLMKLPKSVFGSKVFKASEDCYFFPFAYALTTSVGGVAGEAYPLAVYVGENDQNENMFRIFSSDMSFADNMFSWMVPLKKGQILAIWNGGKNRSEVNDKCFWLPMQSLAPQIAMPDYNRPSYITAEANAENPISEAGFLFLYANSSSDEISTEYFIYCKGEWHRLNCDSDKGGGACDTIMIPVSAGDKWKCDRKVSPTSKVATATFFPCKSVQQQSEKEDILNLLYPVGSLYFDGNNGSVCPLKAVISGSDWEEVGTKLLTGGSTAPVVGNGKTLGLTDGTNSGGFIYDKTYGASLRKSSFGTDVGSAYSSGSEMNERTIGVTADPSNSGLVADLGSATGITVKIWKRTS